ARRLSRHLQRPDCDRREQLDCQRTRLALHVADHVGERAQCDRRDVATVGADEPAVRRVDFDRAVGGDRGGAIEVPTRGRAHATSANGPSDTAGAGLAAGRFCATRPMPSPAPAASSGAMTMKVHTSSNRFSTSCGAGLPNTATRTETPSTKPSCRAMLTTAEPVAKRSGGSDAVAALATDGSTSPTPMPLRIMPGTKRVTYSG